MGVEKLSLFKLSIACVASVVLTTGVT